MYLYYKLLNFFYCINFIEIFKVCGNAFFTAGPLVQSYLDAIKKTGGVPTITRLNLAMVSGFEIIDAIYLENINQNNISIDPINNICFNIQITCLVISSCSFILAGLYIISQNISMTNYISYDIEMRYAKVKNLFSLNYNPDFGSVDNIQVDPITADYDS